MTTTLDRYPDAFVVAGTSVGLWTDLPAAVAAAGHRTLKLRAGPELVIAEQREGVIEAWKRTLANGEATIEVVLAGAGEPSATLYMFDTREAYGVLIAVVAVEPGVGWEPPADVASAANAPQRLVRTTLSAVGTLVDADDLVPLLLG